MTKPSLPLFDSGDAFNTEPPAAKKIAGAKAGRPEAKGYINWLFVQIWKWLRGLRGSYADIMVGSAAQVTSKVATHTIDDFDTAIVDGDHVTFLADAGTRTGSNIVITEDDIIFDGETEAALDVGAFTFSATGLRNLFRLKVINAGAGEVTISGAGSHAVLLDTAGSVLNIGTLGSGNAISSAVLEYLAATIKLTGDIPGLTSTGTIIIENNAPDIRFKELDGSTDKKNVQFRHASDVFRLTMRDDSLTVVEDAYALSRNVDGSANIHTFKGDDFDVLAPIKGESIEVGDSGDRTAFKVKIIDIGDWNMDATSGVSVSHGLIAANIRSIVVTIRVDSGAGINGVLFDIVGPSSAGVDGGWELDSDGSTVAINRIGAGFFDSTNFDSTSFNRGWVIIHYT